MAPRPTPAPVMPIPRSWYRRQTTSATDSTDSSDTDSTDSSDSSSGSSTIPTCVSYCMAEGDLGNCTALTDYTCVCSSAVYQQSVANCWAASCNATEILIGAAYSDAACEYYGVNITTTYSAQTGTETGTANGATNGTAAASTTAAAAATDTSTAPVVYSKAAINIQAIMSSICSALLLVALVMGFLSCRARVRRNQAVSQSRSWTGAGSTLAGGGAKGGAGSQFARSGVHPSAYGAASRPRDPTATYASDNFGATSATYGTGSYAGSSFGNGQVSFGTGLRGNRVGAGFTNRLMLNDIGREGEEWEMGDKTSKVESESPTTPTTRMGAHDAYVATDSTAELNVLVLRDDDTHAH
ncbi:hypothetical protein Q5752_005032 [Cryptotrichosporon argae]